jgi:hypothetical protein
VAVIMVGILVTGVAADNAIGDVPPRPVEISDGVTVTPLPDWSFGGRSEDGKTVLLSKGGGSVAITVGDGTDVAAALNALRDEWLATGTVTASAVAELQSARPGATALGFDYSGTFPDQGAPVEGEVTGYGGTSVTVLFDGWADFGGYRNVSDEVAEMIRTAVIP